MIEALLIAVAVIAVLIALCRDPDDMDEPVSLESPSASRAPSAIEHSSRRRR